MIRAGAACTEVTPPAGLAMAGFAARGAPALGAHDPLTVRALVVGDTALVVADVIGIDAATSARIRARAGLDPRRVIVAATHTHGGPASMADRLGGAPDPAWMSRLENACVATLEAALAARRPARLTLGFGADPGIARNRRDPGGKIDPALPVLWLRDAAGRTIAVLTGHACHPVVLGADNRLWTADYPHFVRRAIEAAHPGALAVWVTGCAGDANTGHSAADSLSLAPDPARSFEEAARVAQRIVEAALAAPEIPLDSRPESISANEAWVTLHFSPDKPLSEHSIDGWRTEMADAVPARAALLRQWIAWAEGPARRLARPIAARVSALNWGGAWLIGLPGEIFAETSLTLRAATRSWLVPIGYADDNPGYIPPRSAFAHGGYEIDEAHRYYGQPAAFAPGTAEALADAAGRLVAGHPSSAGAGT